MESLGGLPPLQNFWMTGRQERGDESYHDFEFSKNEQGFCPGSREFKKQDEKLQYCGWIEFDNRLSVDLTIQNLEIFAIGPAQFFSQSGWTKSNEDIDIINNFYQLVFNEVVIENKRMVCFLPLSECFRIDWFELSSWCKTSNYALEIYKIRVNNVDNYGLSVELFCSWKRFVYFLIVLLWKLLIPMRV